MRLDDAEFRMSVEDATILRDRLNEAIEDADDDPPDPDPQPAPEPEPPALGPTRELRAADMRNA